LARLASLTTRVASKEDQKGCVFVTLSFFRYGEVVFVTYIIIVSYGINVSILPIDYKKVIALLRIILECYGRPFAKANGIYGCLKSYRQITTFVISATFLGAAAGTKQKDKEQGEDE
jgi:hypothetical protein